EAVQPPIGGSRPNVRSPSDPAVGRGSSVPHAPSRRGGSAPVAPSIGRHRSSSMRPPSVPSVPAVPLAPPRAPAVVARPAIVVGSRRRSGSGVSLAARGPKVPLAPNRESRGDPVVPLTVPKRASQQTPRARPRSLPNLFGSDLISERSLDEVILHYLSEDSEGKNSEPDS
ncbi:MAG: hypothetical protein KAI47_27230, partial [Deltaproteobacteria bacterium]|nr:hypothetical protein [Deltaproteobacteria bacterium]